jgi:hypothetical protein
LQSKPAQGFTSTVKATGDHVDGPKAIDKFRTSFDDEMEKIREARGQ